MGTIQLPQDFKDFLRLLASHRVEYLLVGGYAVGYHGYPRATVDMDVWVARSEENAERLVAVLREFGFVETAGFRDVFLEENQVIRMGVPPLRIEIITSVSGIEFGESYPLRIAGQIDGITVDLIDLDHLKRNKKASGRHKDLADLENLP